LKISGYNVKKEWFYVASIAIESGSKRVVDENKEDIKEGKAKN